MKRTPLVSKTPLKKSPIKRNTPLNDVSDKTKKRDAEYRRVVPLKGVGCWCCGRPATDRHHVYSKKDASWMVTEPLNMVPVCRPCHDEIGKDHKGFRARLRLHESERMEFLDTMAKTQGKSNAGRVF